MLNVLDKNKQKKERQHNKRRELNKISHHTLKKSLNSPYKALFLLYKIDTNDSYREIYQSFYGFWV